MLLQNEFIELAVQDKASIKKLCRNITIQMGHVGAFDRLLDLRREIQEACAKYSKNKTALDGIQLNAIKITRWLELWCGEWFRNEAKKEIMRNNPDATLIQKQRLAEHEWEKYLRKISY